MEKQDFDEYVNGQWKKENPIPEKYARWGCFENLFEQTNPKIKELVSGEGGGSRNLAALYKTGMIEHTGHKNAENWMNTIKNSKSLEKTIYTLQECNIPVFFGMYASQDAKKSDIVVPHLYSSGLGLPDRDYYFDEDKEETRIKYKQFIEELISMYNPDVDAKELATRIYNVEEELAKVHYTRVEKRDPHKRYNVYTCYEFGKL